MLKGLKAFLMRGNVIDLGVAVVMGSAFNQVVNSFVSDVLTPIIGALGGTPDFSSLKLGPVAIGKFINAVLNFLIVGSAIYFLVIVPFQKIQEMKKKEEAAAPPEPPEEVKLLREILEELRKR